MCQRQVRKTRTGDRNWRQELESCAEDWNRGDEGTKNVGLGALKIAAGAGDKSWAHEPKTGMGDRRQEPETRARDRN